MTRSHCTSLAAALIMASACSQDGDRGMTSFGTGEPSGAASEGATGMTDTVTVGTTADSDGGTMSTSTESSGSEPTTGTDGTDTGMPDACDAPTSCMAQASAGSISGDSGGVPLQFMGNTSAWTRIRVTENYRSVDGKALRVTVGLTVPLGEDYDLYVYMDEGQDVVECNTVAGGSTTMGDAPEEVTLEWGEGVVANNVDDDRWLSIEVRAVAATCAPTSSWTLVVTGDT